MRHGSLFTGIGGFDLAAQWMGWENVFQVEWDKWCQKVLAKNFPDALRFGDIVEFNKMLQDGKNTTDAESRESGEQKAGNGRQNTGRRSKKTYGQLSLGHIDIITGGFPCQPFSHAGKRKGVDDSRYLWPEMLTTIRIFKPSFVVGENVAGLVSMENGKTLERILSDLENEGYQTESFIIPACAVGAWHRRDRIWIVANRQSQQGSSGNNGGKQREVSQEEQIKFRGMGCQFSTNSISQRGCSGNTDGEYAENVRQLRGSEEYGSGNFIPSVGGMASRLPSWMDRYWDREPEGIPRVATGVKNRVDRLKGLGNAIVPQIALQLFKAIAEYKNI
jgi:DNA (cytosine-5)-methyltransferase 1